jgi:hypothetical protein
VVFLVRVVDAGAVVLRVRNAVQVAVRPLRDRAAGAQGCGDEEDERERAGGRKRTCSRWGATVQFDRLCGCGWGFPLRRVYACQTGLSTP